MIWRLLNVEQAFIDAWTDAGRIRQHVVDRQVQAHGQYAPAQRNQNEPRWYYLHYLEPRIRLATVGLPLDQWQGGAKIIIGTCSIIGEFDGNSHLVGERGLKLQMEPLDMLRVQPDDEFVNGMAVLLELSNQIMDRDALRQYEQREARRLDAQRRRQRWQEGRR